jgi:nucleoporin NUP159
MTWKPKKTAEEAEDEHPPLAGSPAVQVEAPESSVPSSPLDDGDDEGDISVEEQEHEEKEDGDQEEDEEEEEEEEEEQEEDEPSGSVRRPRTQNSGWKFSDSVSQSPHIPPQAPTPPVKSTATSRSREKSRSPSRSPARLSIFQQPQKTAAPSSLFGRSTTPSTFSKPGPIFPPPAISRVQENIRSPSPIRSASTSALGTRRQQLSHAPTPLAASLQQPPKPPTPAPEVSDLSDDEDERIRQELSSEVLPSRDLDEFIAHQDYKGSAGKPGIPGQIELVYRDINSMIDTLGLNARSLAAFIKYHETPIRHSELTPNDLDDVIDQGEDGDWYSKWCLTEIPDLGALVAGLEKSLDHGKVQDALGKLRQVGRVQGEKAKILTKINELRRQISNRKDVEKAEMLRSAPLPKDQADQQKTLRNEYAKLLTQLADAEEAIMFLRTKLASANAEKGQMKAVPTVDAVKKTINKMIAMTEKKNNDIVLLEAQLRKIGLEPSDRLKSSTRVRGTPGRSSVREQSPFPTPGSRGKMSIADLNRSVRTPEPDDDTPSKGFGLFYTPPGSPTRTSFNLKIADDMNDEDLEFLKETTKRRKQVAASLKSAVLKRGVKVTRMN